MSSHRSDRQPRRGGRNGRTRAALSLLALAVVATGASVEGTFAAWTDSATVQTGPFSSGTLDITLGGQLAGPGTTNNPGTWNNTTSTLLNMSPGESHAVSFPVRNNGSTPLKYTVTGTGSGALAVANGMQFAVYFGATASNSGTESGANRVGSCGGATPTDATGTTLTGTAATFATDRALTPAQSENVCIVARLSSAAPNTLQGQTMTAAFLFHGRQVTA